MITEIIFDWIKEGIRLNPPITKAGISTCEDATGFKFPNDFIEFYLLHNGFEQYVMDSKLLSLWPIEKIQAEFDPKDGFIAFSDYLVSSHWIGYIKGQDGIYKDYNRTLICTNFTEFLAHWKRKSLEYI